MFHAKKKLSKISDLYVLHLLIANRNVTVESLMLKSREPSQCCSPVLTSPDAEFLSFSSCRLFAAHLPPIKMVYDSDFYTTRRPYRSSPAYSSYTVSIWFVAVLIFDLRARLHYVWHTLPIWRHRWCGNKLSDIWNNTRYLYGPCKKLKFNILF